jgi:hypothetical protein
VILILSLIGAGVALAAAVARMVTGDRRRRGGERDRHWGEWPPDQMAP